MSVINLETIIEANDAQDLASRTEENFATLEGVLPTEPITALSRWPGGHVTFRFVITHADLTEASNGTAQAISLLTLPADCAVESVRVKHSAEFSGGGAATLDVKVGIAGTVDKYASAFDLLQAVGSSAQLFAQPMMMPPGAEGIIATITPDASHNLAALTTGSVTIAVTIAHIPAL
jgi:hypothetical protein